jgi:fructokinase
MIQMAADIRIGVDLGGTKTEVVALDRSGRERFRRRVPSPRGNYAETVVTVAHLAEEAAAASGASVRQRTASVGVGIPGTISPATGMVKNANSVHLIGHSLDGDLAAALGAPVRLANDADCFALSEATDGAAAGADVVFGVIIGTGVGGGLVVNGRIVRGPNAITGEWGHNPLPWPTGAELEGARCYCGKTGCIETYLSGPGLSRDAGGRDAMAVAAAAEAGDRDARAAVDRYIERFARASATVINVIDPEVIVLGGGLSQIARLYAEVPQLWPRYVFSDVVVTRLVVARHGDASGVRGAAWLWP